MSNAHGFLLCGVLVWCGCGGDVTDEKETSTTASGTSGVGGDVADAVSSGAGAGGASAGSVTASSSTGSGGVDDCANVPQYIENLLAAATACNAADPVPHCQDVVDGFCCPVTVESISSPETQAYLDFLALTQRQCPEMWRKCQAVDCAFPETGICATEGASDAGHCQPFPR